MLSQLLSRRVLWGGILLGLYGVWVACVRLPSGLNLGTLVLSSLWALAIFPAMGMVVVGGVALLASVVTRPIPAGYRAAPAAAIETTLVFVLFVWLFLNEVVYITTSEVIGYETLCMAWYNFGPTCQVAWQMGAKYLITVAVAGIIVASVVYKLSLGSFRRVWPAIQPPSDAPSRPAIRRFRLASPLTLPFVMACLLTWQFHSPHTEALAVLFRSAPPLRALNLTRALVGDDFRSSKENLTGPRIVSDDIYQAQMGAPRSPAPNIILIVLESVPAHALHCYGHPRPDVSPNMDALADQGVRFDHCWSTASFSSYGLVSAMTSLFMLRGENNDHFADTSFPHVSLPRALKLAGYQTGIFSSGNESFDNINHFCRPADFDRYYTQDSSGLQHPDCMRADDHFAIEEFEKWLPSRPADRPLYASFYLQATHFNYQVPEPWASYYQPTPPFFGNGDGILHIPPDVLPKLRNQYDNSMRYSDYWVGRIRANLEKAGLWDNTVVVILGDHGEGFMEHGLARHGTHLWEELVHIPLIVYLGKTVRESLPSAPPSTVPDTVSGLDVAPTVAGLVGIKPHPSWQGRNILAPGYTSQDRPIFSLLQLTRWQEAVCLEKFKYIYDLSDAQSYLFDLNADPDERNNLFTQAPEVAAILRDMLGACHARQLAYYTPANRPFTFYLEPFQPTSETLTRFHAAAASFRSRAATQPAGK